MNLESLAVFPGGMEPYVAMLRQHQMIPSMSRPANPYDHASCESFLKTLKREEIYATQYRDLWDLRSHIEIFIEQYYNRKRLHSALGSRPPEEFEHSMGSEHTVGAATMEYFRLAAEIRSEGVIEGKETSQ